MDRSQEKTTVPYPPVGADGGQSLSQKPNQSIAEGVTEHKPPERDLEEILRQISRVNDPAYLPTVSMNDLYEQVYPGRPPVVDGLLYAGTYLFVGAPKVGKSFLMAQLAYPCGGMRCARGQSSIWPWRTTTVAYRSGCTGCLE